MAKTKSCGRCGGSGQIRVKEYDPTTKKWISVPPVTCIGCNGSGQA